MDWNEQTEAMVKAFAEAQKKMWESWFDVIRAAPASPLPFPSVANQWRELAAQGLKGWTSDTEQVVKDVAERLLSTQDAMMRFLELSVSAWKAMTPKVESGEDWQTLLRNYADQLRQELVQFPQGGGAQDMGKLWRLYLEQWQKLGQPWAESLQRTPRHFGQAATGDGLALMELTNLYWDAYERTFGRLLESPSLGHTRELNQDLLKGFNTWLDFRRASFDYQVVLAETWAKSFEQFMRKLISLSEKGEPVENLRQLLFLWFDMIDEAFLEVFRSEDYIRLQGQLVNTAMAYRLAELDIVEAFLKTSHVPTRRELDEAYRRIYDLRKEMKELKKALREVKEELSKQTSVSRMTKDATDEQ